MADTQGKSPKKTLDGLDLSLSAYGSFSDVSLGDAPLGNRPGGAGGKHDLSFLHPAQGDDEVGRLGNYRLLRILGEGGMGLVFQAHDPGLDRIIALKVMHPRQAQNERAKQRFLVEARAVAKVEHENIVPIYQVAEDNGVPFIAMPLLQGETLAQRLKRQGSLPWQEAARIAREISEGLAAAHAKGLIHRDIKPANIWLDTPPSPRKPSRARILDFGLVRNKNENTRVTQLGAVLGTPAYMSPEQARGDEVDARTDLFSVGSILYQMCTGKQPFPGNNAFEIISALANQTPKPMRELNPQIPEGMSQLVVKLLEKDRDRRLSSAEHIIQGLTLLEKNPAHSFLKGATNASAAPDRTAANTAPLTGQAPAAAVPGVAARAFEFAGDEVVVERLPKVRSIAKSKGLPMGAWIGIGVGAAVLVGVIVLIFMLGKGSVPDKQAVPQIAEAVKPKPPALPPALINDPAPPPGVKPIVKVDRPPELKPPVVAAVRPEITNSLGMKLVQIDPGSFEVSISVRKVEITKGFHIGKYEVTRGQFKEFVRATGFQSKGGQTLDPLTLERSAVNASWEKVGFPQGDDHPVVNVDWQDAKEFCKWLSEKEGKTYTLPTGAEWEYCCRAGTDTTHFAGDTLDSLAGFANASDQTLLDKIHPDKKIPAVPFADGFAYTAPVGSFKPNSWGLHDTLGNVYEWSEDYVKRDQYQGKDPMGEADSNQRTARGGSFHSLPSSLSSSGYVISEKTYRNFDRGFRVILREEGKAVAVKPPDPPIVPPAIADEIPLGLPYVVLKKPAITNSIGMTFLAIEPGTFTMGSPVTEASRSPDETEQIVELTKPFHIGKFEVTRAQFRIFIGATGYKTDGEKNLEAYKMKRGAIGQPPPTWLDPGFPQEDDHPVVAVSWNDAKAFCAWLSKKEGKTYSLPTEAEWEYCCRGGTTTAYYYNDRFGYKKYIHVTGAREGEISTMAVGKFAVNPWGLFHIVGNAPEWCEDDQQRDGVLERKDPVVLTNSDWKVVRGEVNVNALIQGRSARRTSSQRSSSVRRVGMRLVLREEGMPIAVKPPDPPVVPPPPVVKDVAAKKPEIVNSLGMKLVAIQPGTFQMGSPDNEPGRGADEFRHEVELTKGFYIGKYEVTRAEFKQFCDSGYRTMPERTGSGEGYVVETKQFERQKGFNWRSCGYEQADDHPVVCLEWKDAVAFCDWLSQKEGKTYTLPTEAEWEYCCRAGTTSVYYWGEKYADVSAHENFPEPPGERFTRPVGLSKGNAWGLHDMVGNVSEWTQDGTPNDFYKNSPRQDPVGPPKYIGRAVRGGFFQSQPTEARSAYRRALHQNKSPGYVGFRIVLREEPAKQVGEVKPPMAEVKPPLPVPAGGRVELVKTDANGALAFAGGFPKLSPDGSTLFYVDKNRSLKFGQTWDWQQQTTLSRDELPRGFSPDGEFAVAGTQSGSGVTRIWDMKKKDFVATLDITAVSYIAFSSDMEWFAAAGYGKVQGVTLYRVKTWQEVKHWALSTVKGVAFAPDGRTLHAFYETGGMTYDIGTGEAKPFDSPTCYFAPLSPDQKHVVFVYPPNRSNTPIEVRTVPSLKVMQKFKPPMDFKMYSAAISEDNRYVAAGFGKFVNNMSEPLLVIYDVATGEEAARIEPGAVPVHLEMHRGVLAATTSLKRDSFYEVYRYQTPAPRRK